MGKEWQWSRASRREEKEVVPGCMSGMMHFFDFHQLLFSTSTCTRPPQEEAAAAAAAAGSSPQNQHNYSADELKGLEAPRNSLELDEVAAAKVSAPAAGDYYFGIPLAPAPSPVKKKKKQELHLLVEEEKRSSQAVTPRTPNVVARLMGLEILPDDEFFTPTAGSLSASLQHSPKITTKSKKVNKKTNSDHESRGESTTPPPPPARQPLQRRDCNVPSHAAAAAAGSSRSLPETPRASSERYRDADPRLSLQLNKENSNRSVKEYNYPSEAPGERLLPPSPSLHPTNARRRDCLKVLDENKSPRSRYYAREIVKQVKESISRRGGSAANGSSSDEYLLKSRRTRASTAEKNAIGNNESKNSAAKPSPTLSPPQPPPPPPMSCIPSCSPEFDIPRPQLKPKPSPCTNPSTSSFSYAATRDYQEAKGNKMGSTKCQRASYERFTERITRHTPPPALSASPSNMAAAVRRRKLEASQDHRQSPPEPPVHQEKLLNGSVKSAALGNQICSFHRWPRKLSKELDPEFHYVRSILERAGIMDASARARAQQQARWFSPSLPIHPFVFHQLELDLPIFPGPVRHRCNRKLLFHLVDEILGELVGWSATRSFSVDDGQHRRLDELDKELLLERLWSQIRGFPSANCQVVGDIDVLVAGDLTETRVKRLLQHPSVVAEAEDIVLEIEQDVLDSILGEAAASLFTCWE